MTGDGGRETEDSARWTGDGRRKTVHDGRVMVDGRSHDSPGSWNQWMEDGARDTVHGRRQTIIRYEACTAARSGGSRSIHRTRNP